MTDTRKQQLLEKLAAAKTDSKGKTLAKVVGGTALGAVLGGVVGGPANMIRRLTLSVAKDARKARALKKMPLTKRIAHDIKSAAGYSDEAAAIGGVVNLLRGWDAYAKGTIAGGVGGGVLGGYLAGRKKKDK